MAAFILFFALNQFSIYPLSTSFFLSYIFIIFPSGHFVTDDSGPTPPSEAYRQHKEQQHLQHQQHQIHQREQLLQQQQNIQHFLQQQDQQVSKYISGLFLEREEELAI